MRTLALISASIFATNLSFAACLNYSDKNVQDILEKDRVQYHIPGMEVSVSCTGDTATRDYVSGTVLKDGGAAVQNDNFFQIGSETKSFIAVIILRVEAEGLLSINDKIGNYLPQINPLWKNITIKQLLNHTSGIYNYSDVIQEKIKNGTLRDFNKEWSSEELVNLVNDRPVYFAPGKGWHYSNTNYVLAGMIIEAVTKKPIAEEINTRLLSPLALTNTHYWPTSYNGEILSRMAHGYSERGYLPNEPVDITYMNHSWLNAAGGIISNTHDMVTWTRKLSANELLPFKQMIELTSVVDVTNGQPMPNTTNKIGYGLGIQHDYQTYGEDAWYHSGSTVGYNSLIVWLKHSNIIITVNVNHITGDHDAIAVAKDVAKVVRG